jgi:hypothetical protein
VFGTVTSSSWWDFPSIVRGISLYQHNVVFDKLIKQSGLLYKKWAARCT